MGTCYSSPINEDASDNENIVFRLWKRDSKRDKKKIKEYNVADSSNGNVTVNENETLLVRNSIKEEIVEPVFKSTYHSSKESEMTFGVNECSVVPSDSGIESLSTVGEDIQIRHREGRSFRKNKRLSRRLERLSRGSCVKCGNFKLDDSALTALLADTYCLCGPRRAGQPVVNPLCQTHGTHKNKTHLSHRDCLDLPDDDQIDYSLSSDHSTLNSRAGSYSANVKDRVVRISLHSSESLDENLDSMVKDGSSSDLEERAPLARGESSNTLPRRLSSHRHTDASSRSLLTEILDITDAICRCDFYSNEICCQEVDEKKKSSWTKESSSSEFLPKSDSAENVANSQVILKSDLLTSSVQKNFVSLPHTKMVSFANESQEYKRSSNKVVGFNVSNNIAINPAASKFGSSQHRASESNIPSALKFKGKLILQFAT